MLLHHRVLFTCLCDLARTEIFVTTMIVQSENRRQFSLDILRSQQDGFRGTPIRQPPLKLFNKETVIGVLSYEFYFGYSTKVWNSHSFNSPFFCGFSPF